MDSFRSFVVKIKFVKSCFGSRIRKYAVDWLSTSPDVITLKHYYLIIPSESLDQIEYLYIFDL